jgi:hypothetical protein
MNIKSRHLRAGVAALAVLTALTACAKEKDDNTTSTPVTSSSPTPTGTPTTTPDQVQAFCNSLVALDTAIISLGPPEEEPEPGATATPGAESPSEAETGAPMAAEGGAAGGPPSFPDVATAMRPVADMMAATKTREISTAADTMIALLRQAVSTNDRKLLENEAYAAADAPLDAYGLQNCAYKSISTSAIDYEFDNLVSTAQAGKTTITLKNEGKEFHEIVLLRINDGVTDSVDAIMALPEEQLFSRVTPAFVTVVPPGMSGTGFTDLKAGKYIVLCFIPKGAEPGKEPAHDAKPHFLEGMLEELTVT